MIDVRSLTICDEGGGRCPTSGRIPLRGWSRVADRVLVLDRGHVCEQGALVSVLTAQSHPTTRALVAVLDAAQPGRQEVDRYQGVTVDAEVLAEQIRTYWDRATAFLDSAPAPGEPTMLATIRSGSAS